MKKALLCRQGKLNDDTNFIVSYSSLESHCPPFIPENKTKIIVWVWDCRIEKARQHKLAWFLSSTIKSMVDTRNRISSGGQN